VSSPERDLAKASQVLARKAGEDATAVREFAANPEIADGIIGFHAQQAVEKWLKAVIADRGGEYEYTHDLHRLLSLAADGRSVLTVDVDSVLALTQYAVPLRYEDLLDVEPLDREATVTLIDEVAAWAAVQLQV
jgi:HEPN domain-containing protein